MHDLALVRMDESRPMRSDRVDMLEVALETAESTRAAFPGRVVNVRSVCELNFMGEVSLHRAGQAQQPEHGEAGGGGGSLTPRGEPGA